MSSILRTYPDFQTFINSFTEYVTSSLWKATYLIVTAGNERFIISSYDPSWYTIVSENYPANKIRLTFDIGDEPPTNVTLLGPREDTSFITGIKPKPDRSSVSIRDIRWYLGEDDQAFLYLMPLLKPFIDSDNPLDLPSWVTSLDDSAADHVVLDGKRILSTDGYVESGFPTYIEHNLAIARKAAIQALTHCSRGEMSTVINNIPASQGPIKEEIKSLLDYLPDTNSETDYNVIVSEKKGLCLSSDQRKAMIMDTFSALFWDTIYAATDYHAPNAELGGKNKLESMFPNWESYRYINSVHFVQDDAPKEQMVSEVKGGKYFIVHRENVHTIEQVGSVNAITDLDGLGVLDGTDDPDMTFTVKKDDLKKMVNQIGNIVMDAVISSVKSQTSSSVVNAIQQMHVDPDILRGFDSRFQEAVDSLHIDNRSTYVDLTTAEDVADQILQHDLVLIKSSQWPTPFPQNVKIDALNDVDFNKPGYLIKGPLTDNLLEFLNYSMDDDEAQAHSLSEIKIVSKSVYADIRNKNDELERLKTEQSDRVDKLNKIQERISNMLAHLYPEEDQGSRLDRFQADLEDDIIIPADVREDLANLTKVSTSLDDRTFLEQVKDVIANTVDSKRQCDVQILELTDQLQELQKKHPDVQPPVRITSTDDGNRSPMRYATGALIGYFLARFI